MLEGWKCKEDDERELELHSELWGRLARCALDEKSSQMKKYALKSAEQCLNKVSNNEL